MSRKGYKVEESGGEWYKVVDKFITLDGKPLKAGVCVMFMGEYNHTVDPKGRLIVPSKFREQLVHEFVVTKGLDGCLVCVPCKSGTILRRIPQYFHDIEKDARKFSRFFFCWGGNQWSGQAGQNSASAGFARICQFTKKDVVLVGVLSRVEIWDKDRWQENTYDEDEMDEIAEHMADLGFSI